MSGKLKLVLAAGVVAIAALIGFVFFAPQSSQHVDQPETPEEGLSDLKGGKFSGADAVHNVSGRVRLQAGKDKLRLRFEGYDATAGPDVFFYLAKGADFDPEAALKVPVPGGGSAGQATLRGNFSVPVEGAGNPAEYSHVVVWCQRFGVKFGEAKLQ